MAMSVSALSTRISTANSRVVTDLVTVSWTSAADGSATGTVNLQGFLIKVVTDPGATAPTDNYDISLVQNGIDQLGDLLLNRDTANTEMVYPVVSGACTPIFLAGDHTFTIANAGDSKVGTVYFYIREA